MAPISSASLSFSAGRPGAISLPLAPGAFIRLAYMTGALSARFLAGHVKPRERGR